MTVRNTITAIDRAVNSVCPCGAQPRPGSAYCGPECEPTHVAVHTGRSEMRWRPDLVTATDDTGLTRMCGPIELGDFTRHIYYRDGTNLLHLRLDDGERFVGVDVEQGHGAEFAGLCHRKWKALERELTNPAHAIPDGGIDDPWADTHPVDTAGSLLREIRQRDAARRREDAARHRQVEAARGRLGIPDWQRRCRACGQHGEPVAGVRPAGAPRLVDGGGTAVVELELCQVCPHCRWPHPGPVLRMVTEHRQAEREWRYRMRAVVGDHKFGIAVVVLESRLQAAVDPVAYLRREWDVMETRLLRRIAEAAGTSREPDTVEEP